MTDTSEQTVHKSKVANFLETRVANNVGKLKLLWRHLLRLEWSLKSDLENKDIREAEEGAVGPHNTNNLKKTQPGWETEQRGYSR